MEIDRRSKVPLYYQLKLLLTQNIKQEVWKPGEQLPTEERIEKDYKVSRTTVRQALRELELEGKINRHPGKGTFVTNPKVREGTEPFNITVSEYLEPGDELKWGILSMDWEPAPEDVAAYLLISPGEQTFCLRRSRLLNTEVIGVTASFIPKFFAEYLDLSFAEKGGSMNYLNEDCLKKCKAERVVEALPVGHKDAEFLGIQHLEPVLVISRILRNVDSRPIEFFRGIYRGDRFQYHIQSLPAQK